MNLQGVIVRGSEAAHGGRRLGLDVLVADHVVEVGRVIALRLGGAVPGVDDVLGCHLVPVGELDVLAQGERIRQSIRRDIRHLRGDVGDDVQVVVEFQETVEQVLRKGGIDRGIEKGRIEGADVVIERKT